MPSIMRAAADDAKPARSASAITRDLNAANGQWSELVPNVVAIGDADFRSQQAAEGGTCRC